MANSRIKLKLNDLTKWAAIIIALVAIVYNAIDTRSILRNDVKHIQDDIAEIKLDVRDMWNFIVDKEK